MRTAFRFVLSIILGLICTTAFAKTTEVLLKENSATNEDQIIDAVTTCDIRFIPGGNSASALVGLSKKDLYGDIYTHVIVSAYNYFKQSGVYGNFYREEFTGRSYVDVSGTQALIPDFSYSKYWSQTVNGRFTEGFEGAKMKLAVPLPLIKFSTEKVCAHDHLGNEVNCKSKILNIKMLQPDKSGNAVPMINAKTNIPTDIKINVTGYTECLRTEIGKLH